MYDADEITVVEYVGNITRREYAERARTERDRECAGCEQRVRDLVHCALTRTRWTPADCPVWAGAGLALRRPKQTQR